jgi:FkbH-like protein
MGARDRQAVAPLLARLDVGQARKHWPELPSVTVTITGYGTLDALRTALIAELARHGYLARVRLADFGSYVVELGDPGSELYAERPDVTICVLDHAAVLDEVGIPFSDADVARVLEDKLALWRQLAATFRQHAPGTLVLNTIPLPASVQAQFLDHQSRARLGIAWRSASTGLLELGAGTGPVVVVDIDPLLGGPAELADPRFERYVGAHLSDELLRGYARELAHVVRARTGLAKKVLAVDLDETLWGGVLGDDGIDGIEVAHGRRGAAFQHFQKVVKQLKSQGVLLAAVTKNDRDTVLAALREHPDMRLREEDFARILASWGPKPDSLRQLVRELNVGADSVVFVDDSIRECAEVSAGFPDATVIHLDGDPALHAGRLLADAWFAVPEVTSEDRVRTRRYHEEVARSEFLAEAGSAAGFLATLGVRVRLEPAGTADRARVAQLTLRTNQFNLTTERLSADKVASRADDPRSRVLAISSADRFGSNGIVGAVFLAADGESLRIENFLLSCRVFARGIEQACLSAILAAARDAGFRSVRGDYRASAKNTKVADFYPRHGFTAECVGGQAQCYVHPLGRVADVPAHLSLTVADGIVPAPWQSPEPPG